MSRKSTMSASRRGLTLLELLLAVTITALVALAMATVMTTVARGMSSAGSARSALQRCYSAFYRLRAYTNPALCLLQHDKDRGFAVWIGDTTPGNSVNLREVRVFWFDTDAGELAVERVTFPDAWPEELQESFDVVMSPDDDFLNEMEAQRALGYTSRETMADAMTGFELRPSETLIQQSDRFTLTFKVDAGDDGVQDILTLYSLPNQMEPR